MNDKAKPYFIELITSRMSGTAPPTPPKDLAVHPALHLIEVNADGECQILDMLHDPRGAPEVQPPPPANVNQVEIEPLVQVAVFDPARGRVDLLLVHVPDWALHDDGDNRREINHAR